MPPLHPRRINSYEINLSRSLCSCNAPLAEDSVSNAELSRKLDLILGKVSGLEERVSELEKANSEVKKEMQAVQKTATEAKNASQSFVLPETKRKNRLWPN